ncbi:MAG: ATP-binding cassette domain-containing protein [Verrucomicrobia bacterium]|nr:ATP-binding cassette domain-containing protein [Verrucomicrobiota bacterium]NBU08573.1 ATP-binding cassette domain-containing protein [Pseudomonadota bacterium]NDA65472.1 ATP-binding cassette domain-containing protein [Verrucomicrobiota bacterium]NDD37338.1 ATP-binding cassette domain-containing protein [Verrucomicrobiota bacterium]NDE97186.1 ATP-binding cassette domain-containing protein [Verrucomicrobiota bacterium]
MPPIVQLENVNVSLAGKRVLHGVNWRWQPGECWSLRGANGSGKSTFLRLVAGELAPDPGDGGRRTYWLDGTANPSAIGVRDQLAFVSPEQQERYLNLEWARTGRDVLLTGFHQTDYLYRRLTAEQKLAAEKITDELRLGPLLRRDVQTLSQGEFRRLLIARALLAKPRVLLLDEFTDGLDTAMRDALLAAVQRAAATGTSVLCATHREDERFPALRHEVVLEQGRVVTAKKSFAAKERKGHKEAKISQSHAGACASEVDSSLRPLRSFAANPFLFRLRGASVYLDRRAVLRDLDWEMRPGEHWAVMGPNGSGKSTFLKLLLGEQHPAVGGSIHRFNETRRHTLWEIRARTGYAGPDLQTAYRDGLTVAQVVASGWFASIGLLDAVTPVQWRRVRELLAEFGLAELAERNYLQLSYGQRRRVLLARAVVHDPEVLLLDEPLDGLDAESLARMREHLAALAAQRVALIVVTHRREELPALPFRVHTFSRPAAAR